METTLGHSVLKTRPETTPDDSLNLEAALVKILPRVGGMPVGEMRDLLLLSGHEIASHVIQRTLQVMLQRKLVIATPAKRQNDTLLWRKSQRGIA